MNETQTRHSKSQSEENIVNQQEEAFIEWFSSRFTRNNISFKPPGLCVPTVAMRIFGPSEDRPAPHRHVGRAQVASCRIEALRLVLTGTDKMLRRVSAWTYREMLVTWAGIGIICMENMSPFV